MSIFSFDLFSQPFKFRFQGKDAGRKTVLGTLCSVFVILISLAYFIYLMYVFFNGDLVPKVIVQSNTITKLEHSFDVSPIMIYFHKANQDIKLENYFQYHAYYNKGDNTQAERSEYLCIKPENDDGSKSMELYVDDTGQSNYVLLQQKACTNDPGGSTGQQGGKQDCKDPSVIESLMKERFFKIDVFLVYYEFDISNSKLSQRNKQITLQGDYNTVTYYNFYAEVSKLSEDKGWLWSSVTEHNYVSGYDVDVAVLDRDFFREKTGGYSIDKYFSYFQFQLQLKQTETKVTYPKISEVFAQFGAMVSIFLYIGLIAKFNSEAQIYQEMAETMIREYYKTTAQQMIQQDLKEEMQKKQECQKKGIQHKKSVQEIIMHAKKSRERELKTMWRVYVPRKAQKKQQVLDSQNNIDSDLVYGQVLDRVISNMNCSHLFQEMYKLKTAVQVLLTPKQYAALNYVGRAIPEDYSQREDRNQIEDNDYTEENVQQRERLLGCFLKDMQSGVKENEFSQVIYDCLLQQVKEGEYRTGFLQGQGKGMNPGKTINQQEDNNQLKQQNLDKQDQENPIEILDQFDQDTGNGINK